jgi:hypothetical protein
MDIDCVAVSTSTSFGAGTTDKRPRRLLFCLWQNQSFEFLFEINCLAGLLRPRASRLTLRCPQQIGQGQKFRLFHTQFTD